MKVIKRDGRAVDYDRAKISIAIEKANKEVKSEERASKENIKDIITYIEELNKKRMLVEDIQDIIEEKLMEIKKYELAKKYIVYRYTRALVRKQNTTDDSILGLIRNENKELEEETNKNALLASAQRDYIAGEVSKDLTSRLKKTKKIAKADSEGIIHFHDSEYFVQPIFNSSLINIADMLDNGTVINGKVIESPKSFLVACIVTTQIIEVIATNQYGGQAIDMIHFGKYLRKSYFKIKKQIEEETNGKISDEIVEELTEGRVKAELKSGIQIMQYQINALEESTGKKTDITLFLHLDENDTYLKENAMIVQEILNQRCEGVKDEDGKNVIPEVPKLVYLLDDCNTLNGGKFDYLTRIAIECSKKCKFPIYLSAKMMKENYETCVFSPIGEESFLIPWKNKDGNYQFEGRFNQGVVSINLPQIAILSDGNEKEFWRLLDERLDLCFEALMCRHYSLVGIKPNISPLHWKYGAIAHLSEDEKIDSLLYGNYSTITLGYLGLYETTKFMKQESQMNPKGYEFAMAILKHLQEIVEKWRKETNIGFVLSGITSKKVATKFAKIDKEKLGTIKDNTDKKSYTGSYFIDEKEDIDEYERLKLEADFQKISLGGAISIIKTNNLNNLDENKWEEIIKFIYENMQYVEICDSG